MFEDLWLMEAVDVSLVRAFFLLQVDLRTGISNTIFLSSSITSDAQYETLRGTHGRRF